MKYCLRCCYPENARPAIIIDEEGVCSGCRTFEDRPQVDWDEKRNQLQEILDHYKKLAEKNNANWDCIIPVSGGKDSTYVVYLMTQIYKMKPLLVTYNHSFNSKRGIRNLTNIVEKFGCDLLRYSTNPKTAKKLSRYMLKKVGDITWHHHAGLMTFPMQTAARYKIPLVMWGEHGEGFLLGMHNLDDNVEYTKKHRQEHLMRGFEPEDILNDPKNKEITRTDLAPFFYPSDDEINSVGVRGIFTSNFDPWNQSEHTEKMIKEYGFETFQNPEHTFNLYASIDDHAERTHNYLRYLKFGHTRCTDHASLEIRHQRMTREEGISMIEKYEYLKRPKNVDVILKFLDLSEEEFVTSVDHLRDKEIWEKKSNGEWKLLDWIGNHIDDPGVEEVRLPIKEKWRFLKTPINTTTRETENTGDDEELIYL